MGNKRKNSRRRRRNPRGSRGVSSSAVPGFVETVTWSGSVEPNQTLAISRSFKDLGLYTVKVLSGSMTYSGESGSKLQFSLRGADSEIHNPSPILLTGPQPKTVRVFNPKGTDPWIQEGVGTSHVGWITNLGPKVVSYVINVRISARYVLQAVSRQIDGFITPDCEISDEAS